MYRQLFCLALSIFSLSVTAVEATKDSQAATTFTNSIGMQFILIPAGQFVMGTGDCSNHDVLSEREACIKASGDEYPKHEVVVDAFYMGTHEVTQAQWMAVMKENPAYFKEDKIGSKYQTHPVERISWDDAQQFISALNALEKTNQYRLPTEAEWEYAARGGVETAYCSGDETGSQLKNYAWFSQNSQLKTHPVGQKKPNAFGLYDMSGNVWEWTCSAYTANYDGNELKCTPHLGSTAVLRGCSWSYGIDDCHCGNRLRYYRYVRHADDGMRVVSCLHGKC